MTSIDHGGTDPRDESAVVPMESDHLAFLESDVWAEMLRKDLLPWLVGTGELGDDVLEIGPGPGRTTDLLHERARRVTALELDGRLAAMLAERLEGTNVEVLRGDGTKTNLAAGRFTSVTCFHMLHHLPTVALQDQLFEEVERVLAPGGVFLVADALEPGIRAVTRAKLRRSCPSTRPLSHNGFVP